MISNWNTGSSDFVKNHIKYSTLAEVKKKTVEKQHKRFLLLDQCDAWIIYLFLTLGSTVMMEDNVKKWLFKTSF